MKNENLVSVQQFCIHHNIEYTFINSLQEYGLIEITIIEENQYIDNNHIKDLEKMIRLHYELDINIEGIEAITHLLSRVDSLHTELTALKNKLKLFEDN